MKKILSLLCAALVLGAPLHAGSAIIHMYSANRSLEMVAQVLKAQPHWLLASDHNGATLLHEIARHTAFSAVMTPGEATALAKLLIAAGAPLNAQDSDGNTPLHLAAHAGNASLVAVLHRAGASSQVTNMAGKTPIDLVDAQLARQTPVRVGIDDDFRAAQLSLLRITTPSPGVKG